MTIHAPRKSPVTPLRSKEKPIAKTTAARAMPVAPATPARSKPKSTRKSPNAPTNPERVKIILGRLETRYPNAVCALRHSNAWQLMVATILSAQCTDARVNLVTPNLFRRFPTPHAMAAAEKPELEEIIRSTGFFRNKTKSLIGAAQKVVAEFGGNVPQTIEELLTIPGVARKTANVVLGSWFRIGVGVVVDTHVLRITQRLELTKAATPEKIEQDMMHLIPKDSWIDFSHRIIFFGREICIARKPRCADCFLEDLCNSKDKTWSTH